MQGRRRRAKGGGRGGSERCGVVGADVGPMEGVGGAGVSPGSCLGYQLSCLFSAPSSSVNCHWFARHWQRRGRGGLGWPRVWVWVARTPTSAQISPSRNRFRMRTRSSDLVPECMYLTRRVPPSVGNTSPTCRIRKVAI